MTDEELTQVTGGMNRKAFGIRIYEVMEESDDTLTKCSEIVEEVKRKNWLKIAEMAIPMLYEGDPVIIEAYNIAKK